MRNAWRLIFSLAVSAVLLWLAFRHVDAPAVWSQWRRLDPRFVCVYAVALGLMQWIRAYRWHVLVRPFADPNWAASWRMSNIGLMLMALLPLRLGEFARPYLLKQETGAPLASGIGSVGVERCLDGLVVTLMFFATTMLLPSAYTVPGSLRFAAYASLGLFGGAIAALTLTFLARAWVLRLLRRLIQPWAPGLCSKLETLLTSFVDGLAALPDMATVLQVVLSTIAFWAVHGLGLLMMLFAFGWQAPMVAGWTLVSILALGLMIPAGPGFLGTYQASIVLGLSLFGFDGTQAAAYGLVVYPLNMLQLVAFGLPYVLGTRLWRLRPWLGARERLA